MTSGSLVGALLYAACAVAGFSLFRGSGTARKVLAYAVWPLQALGGVALLAFSQGSGGRIDPVVAVVGFGWLIFAVLMVALLTSARVKAQLAR